MTRFELRLPPGTWVNDYVKKEKYILRDGGVRRPIVHGEFNGSNYRQLLEHDPPGQRRFWLLVAVNLAICLVLIFAVAFYRRGARRFPATPG